MEYIMDKIQRLKLFVSTIITCGSRTWTRVHNADRTQIEGQTRNALTNQTQPVAAEDPTTQFSEHRAAETRALYWYRVFTPIFCIHTDDAPNAEDVEQPSQIEGQHESMAEEEIWKKGTKIATVATPLSAGCIIGLGVLFIGSKNTHQYLLAFAEISLCLSFASGATILGLWALKHDPPDMTGLVRILTGVCIAGAASGVLAAAVVFIPRML